MKIRFSKATGIKTTTMPDGKFKTEMQFEVDGNFYPVNDATQDLPVAVSKKAIDKAIPSDPNHCALAEAVRGNVAQASFFKKVAYILFFLPNKKGVLEGIVRRYVYSGKTTASVKKFDKDGSFKPGTYLLKAPTASCTLEAKRGQVRNRKSKRIVSSPVRRTYAGRRLQPEKLV